MLELRGKYNTAKVFNDSVEPSAMSQIIELCNQEFTQGSEIRIMPDVHAGAGCVIGTTMTLQDRVVPNLVGVDIGCVDCETEFLSPTGWVRLDQYNDEHVMNYNPNTGESEFEIPVNYIKVKCDEFYRIKTKYGIDQKLSREHIILFAPYTRSYQFDKIKTISAEALYKWHTQAVEGFRGRFLTTFTPKIKTHVDLTDAELRVVIMIAADGHVPHTMSNTGYCSMGVKKRRKVVRAKKLLEDARIKYTIRKNKSRPECTYISLWSPKIEALFTPRKTISVLWPASAKQLKVIASELVHWDGNVKDYVYFTGKIEEANFASYAIAASGFRSVLRTDIRDGVPEYRVFANKNTKVGINGTPKTPITKECSVDGYKYCFTTSTGYWVMRRRGVIVITGNCGVLATKLVKQRPDLQKLDKVIREHVPSGFAVRKIPHLYADQELVHSLMSLHCSAAVNLQRAQFSIGTLGGGNHFIEIDQDSQGDYWLVVHSGSRNAGKQVAEHYQAEAVKQVMRQDHGKAKLIAQLHIEGRQSEISDSIKALGIPKIPKHLCYVEGNLFTEYLHDMEIMQYYAAVNRCAIVASINDYMEFTETEEFDTIHNYIEIAGTNMLRKGAVSARAGEKLLIPMNMRDGVLLCVGKGNEDWNYSAPHGAGRIMGRGVAKRTLSLDKFKASMEGISSTCVSMATIDESPEVYKPMEEIKQYIGDAVEIVDNWKVVHNFKAADADKERKRG